MKSTKEIIFPAKAKFGPAMVLALVACSVTFAQDVRTNYMPGTDFSKYHTYAWVNAVQGMPAFTAVTESRLGRRRTSRTRTSMR